MTMQGTNYRRVAEEYVATAQKREAEGQFASAADAMHRAADAWRKAADCERDLARRVERNKLANELQAKAKELAAGRGAARPAAPPAGDGPTPWTYVADTGVKLDDVAGMAEAKQRIHEMVVLPARDPEGAKLYRIRLGGGILLYGPPGTGKTYFGKAVAGELKAPFYSVSAADMLSKWLGESQKNMKSLFNEAARHSQAIIYIDEIECLLPSRKTEDEHAQRLVGQFLQEVDGVGGRPAGLLLLGATNHPERLDEAALRPGRFDRLIYVGLPEPEVRRTMIINNMRNIPQEENLDIESFVPELDGYSGADIKNVCEAASKIAFERRQKTGLIEKVNSSDFMRAIGEQPPTVLRSTVERCRQFAERYER